MSIELSHPCRCQGLNPNCYICDGFGFVQADASSIDDGKPVHESFDLEVTKKLKEQKLFDAGVQKAKQKNWEDEIRSRRNDFVDSQNSSIRAFAPSKAPTSTIRHLRLEVLNAVQMYEPLRTLYRCDCCNYTLNTDMNARCAMCGEPGPYVEYIPGTKFGLK